MMFRFALDPVDSIEPWGEPPNLSLSWFGLSMGKYSIAVNDLEVLLYSDMVVAATQANHPQAYPGPQVDYQVVRLHQDLLDIVPDVLDPVPDDAAVLLERYTAVDTMRRARSLAQTLEDNEPALLGLDAILGCLWSRQLDTGYLTPAPLILLWRHADMIQLEWDGQGQTVYGLPAWQFPSGNVSIPSDLFREALEKFHERFIGQMSARVTAIQTQWKRPEVRIDMDELHQSQKYREKQLNIAFSHAPTITDWDAVQMGVQLCCQQGA